MVLLSHHRLLLSVLLASLLGTIGLNGWSWPSHDPVFRLIALHRPDLAASLPYVYALLWFTTALIVCHVTLSTLYILSRRHPAPAPPQPLPPYPPPSQRTDLFLVLGEQHHRTLPGPAATPRWLTIPERGLYTGLAIIGAIGSGKSSACMYPYVEQLLGYRAKDPARKMAALILEVKGDFCHRVRDILERHGRAEDYVEVSLDSGYRYNPLRTDLEAYALAYGIATLMTNLFGRGKEPFWQQAYTNLIKFVILLHQTVDDYVTLFQVYACVINPDTLRAKLAEGERRFVAGARRIIVKNTDRLLTPVPGDWAWTEGPTSQTSSTYWSQELCDMLEAQQTPYTVADVDLPPEEADRAARFEAVRRWFHDDWMRMEPKLRTSIVEGISVFLSLFDDNPRVKHTFCPPKDLYDVSLNTTGLHGTPLPPLADLIEQGKVVVLNFPMAMNPGLARALGTMLKQDFQRAVLNRIPRMTADPTRHCRAVAFVCDEYQAFATTGENEPSGDDKFFSLARQARCVPIVATQSISSLRSTLGGESWRTLLQGLRTKIFLTLSDDYSAQMAADLCGTVERLKPSYTLSEAGQDARVSLLTGRPAAHKTTVSATKSYRPQREYLFDAKVFSELQNAQAVVLAYDGLNPQPPTLCYLKPDYLDVNVSYFDHASNGAL